MDSLLREKLTQLTTKCDILGKNVRKRPRRGNSKSASISWKKSLASRKVSMG